MYVVYENGRAYPQYIVRYIEDEEMQEVNTTAQSDPTERSGISLPHGSPDATCTQVETNDLSIKGKISVYQNDDNEKSVESSDSDDSASLSTTESDTSDDDDGKSDDGSSFDSSNSSDEELINA